MVETLGIIIDIRPKGRPRKRGSQTIGKIIYAYLNKRIEGEYKK